MKCYNCGDRFIDAEDYQDHLPCETQLQLAHRERDEAIARAEKADVRVMTSPGKRYPRAGCPECEGTGTCGHDREHPPNEYLCPACMTSPKPDCVPDGAPWSVSIDGLGRDVAIWWDDQAVEKDGVA